jgi:FMN hydrolase / 5-amino-6-(5-phospho-D-ribitylamino)uracil phosphatase
MLDALCLDLMGTVLYDPYLEAIEAATGMTLPEVVRIKDPDSWPDFEMGRIDEDEFVRRFFTAPEAARTFDIAAFHRVRWEGYRFLPGMAELLDEVSGVVPRYVASNYPVWIEELGDHFEFARRFDGVYASCHLGVRKPDPEFFYRMLAALGVPARRCLFVDDRPANCDAAAAVGMRAHVFDGAEGLRSRLRAERVLH